MLSNHRPRRFLVDTSNTLRSGLNTGVQRVVRNVCKYTPLVASTLDTEVVVTGARGFQSVAKMRQSPQKTRVRHLKADVLRHLPKTYVQSATSLCNWIPSNKLKSWLLPQPGHAGIFKLPLQCLEATLGPDRDALIEGLGKGDLILLPDAYWAQKSVWKPVIEARRNGAFIATLVYDLIPLTHPQFVAKGVPQSFRQYFKQVARNSDLIVAISNTVREEVVAALPDLLPKEDYCRDVRSFQLGSELNPLKATVRPGLADVFPVDARNCPYLMVATFDPRKNHHYLLDAFERIWEQDPSRKLCLIGRVGWLCGDIIQRITSHSRFGRQLFMLNDLTDAELNYCYQRARHRISVGCRRIWPSNCRGALAPEVCVRQ